MKRFITLLSGAMALTAMAAINPDDYPDLQLSTDYPLTEFASFRGKFTAPTSGTVVEYATVPVYQLNSEQELTSLEDSSWTYAGYINGKQAYQFNATEGVTYYFEEKFVINGGVFRIEMNAPISVTVSEPALGGVYSPASSDHILIVFNQNVLFSQATISAADQSAVVDTRTNGSSVAIDAVSTLRKWYANGTLTGGEELTVTLKNLTSADGTPIEENGGNGVYKFIAAPKPVEMVSHVLPSTISSYQAESSENTRIEFTFSGDIEANPTVQLCYALLDIDFEYVEDLPTTVNGNVVTADLAGKRRTSADMSTSGRTDSVIYIRLLSLHDAEGNSVWSSGQGSTGSFYYEVPFNEIARVNVLSEFTPANGSDITNESSINIWFNNANSLSYDGVCFTSGAESVVVPTSELTMNSARDDEADITVAIPQGWNSKSDVVVTLSNLRANDGYDHTDDVTATFNGFVVTYISPADESEISTIQQGQLIVAELNVADRYPDMTVTATLADADGASLFGPAEMTRRVDGSYAVALTDDVTMYAGSDYFLTISAANSGTTLGSKTFTYHGAATPFEFSEFYFDHVTPAEGSTLAADNAVITVTFDGLAYVYPTDATQFASVVAVDAIADGASNVWELTLAPAAIEAANGEITVSFAAYDLLLELIEGNVGAESDSHFEFLYRIGESSISEITADGMTTAESCFDLMGRRVANPTRPGIYIMSGRKVRL